MNLEQWVFVEFLYVVAGAVVIFFATHILLPDAGGATTDVREHYFDSRSRFFGLLGLLMIWSVGIDFLFGDGLTTAGVINLVGLVFFIVMALSSGVQVHRIGTAAGWVFIVAILALRGWGLIG